MTIITSEHANGKGLPRVEGNIPVHVLTGMLSSPENRSSAFLPEPAPSDKAYQLTVRDLSRPDNLIVNTSVINNLIEWWLNFQYDAFKGIPSNFEYPKLPESNAFYTMSFNDHRGGRFEVAVCPVYNKTAAGYARDVIRVSICPPQFSKSHEEKLHSVFFAQDATNVQQTVMMYNDYAKKQAGLGTGDLSAERRRLARSDDAGEVLMGLEIPECWDFAFPSKMGAEATCGDKTIPQILGRMWFLRDCVDQPAHFCVVQLTKLSYVGLLHNVCGFNIYFQVNSSMPVRNVTQYFADYHTHCRLTSRAVPSTLATSPLTRKTGLMAMEKEWEWQNTLRLKVSDKLDDIGAPSTKAEEQSVDLWKRVVTYVDAKVLSYYRAYVKLANAKTVEAMTFLAKQYVTHALSAVVPELSLAMQSKMASAAYQVKFSLLKQAILAIGVKDMLDFNKKVGDKTERDKVLASVDYEDLARVLTSIDLSSATTNGAAMLVPSVLPSYVDLAVFVSSYPEAMGDDVFTKLFGSAVRGRAKLSDGRKQWVAENRRQTVAVDPKRGVVDMGTVVTNDEVISLTQFADWYVNEYAINPNGENVGPSSSNWTSRFPTKVTSD